MVEKHTLASEPQVTVEKQPWTPPTLIKIEIASGTEYGSDFTDDGDGPGPRS